MAKFTLEDTIKTFSYSHAAVVYWFCEGYSNYDIATMLGYEPSWVVWRMSEVYHKLGLDRPDAKGRKLHWSERRKILREKVCPIIKRLTNDDPDFLERFPLIAPNVIEGSILDLRPEIPVPPSEPFVSPPEPPLEPPQLPEPGEILPSDPPPDFYPIELYNAWLAVLEDDRHEEPPPPSHHPPIIIDQERRGIRWSRILALLSAVLLGCAIVGVLAYWFGIQQNDPPLLPTPIPSDTQGIPVTETLAQTAEPSLTALATETLAPTSAFTSTMTVTPIPADTQSPIGLQRGEELRDERVTLRFTDFVFYEGYDRIARKIAAITYRFEFTNHSGEPILLRFDDSNFRVTDNLQIEYPCVFESGVYIVLEINQPVDNGSTLEIIARCGPNQQFGTEANQVTLTLSNFSSLPESTWVVNISP